MTLASGPPDDDLLHALTSFSVLSVRPSILSFLSEMTSRLSKADLTAWSTLLKQLLRAASASCPARHFDEYRPVQITLTGRHAAYSANLLIFAVCAKGSIRASELFGLADPVEEWHRQALLWRSQVRTEEWVSLVEIFALNRLRNGQTRDILIALDDGTFETPAINLDWTYGLPAADAKTDWRTLACANQEARALRRKANFLCGVDDDVVNHALDPLLNAMGHTVNFVVQEPSGGPSVSPANALIKAWLLPLRSSDPEERSAVYELCSAIAVGLWHRHWTTKSGIDLHSSCLTGSRQTRPCRRRWLPTSWTCLPTGSWTSLEQRLLRLAWLFLDAIEAVTYESQMFWVIF